VLTLAFVAGLATHFESQYAWLFAALIVAAVYLLIGGVAAWMGYRELTSQSLAPTRTLRVLKQDQLWLANEARSQ
jgi:3-mercaptopyruvate sulfurtransferase SseA